MGWEGRWRAGVGGGEEEGGLPVHIALEMWGFLFLSALAVVGKAIYADFDIGIGTWSLYLDGSDLHPGFPEIPSSPRRPKGLQAMGSEHPKSHLDNARGWVLVSQSGDSTSGDMFNLTLGCDRK